MMGSLRKRRTGLDTSPSCQAAVRRLAAMIDQAITEIGPRATLMEVHTLLLVAGRGPCPTSWLVALPEARPEPAFVASLDTLSVLRIAGRPGLAMIDQDADEQFTVSLTEKGRKATDRIIARLHE